MPIFMVYLSENITQKENPMLIRVIIENLFSFGERKEFSTISNSRLKTLKHHNYSVKDLELLKLTSIYGANASGKSNFVKSLKLLQDLVLTKSSLFDLRQSKFKLSKKNDKQVVVIDFIQEDTAFYYAIEVSKNSLTEELYLSGLGADDQLIYERKTDEKGKTQLKFFDEFEKDEKGKVLKAVLLEDLVESDKLVFKVLANRNNVFLKEIKKAYSWFENTLLVVSSGDVPSAFAHEIDTNQNFKRYAENYINSVDVGIHSLEVEKKEIDDFFNENPGIGDLEFLKHISSLAKTPGNMINFRGAEGNEILFISDGGKVWAKTLKMVHNSADERGILFDLQDESDGTKRLLDYIPAFMDLYTKKRVVIIDEIERSIHPLLIKELIKKFSLDTETKGQLIFTTHESNLLDQSLFRQDEIWFVEKDEKGSSDIYSLNDFKEHKTIDLRKGYLQGRYGSIPFLGNLKDLHWNEDDNI